VSAVLYKGRRHPRFDLKSAVEFTRWDPRHNVFGFATDVSVGGAFIETAFPAPRGSDVVVRLWPPGWDEEVLLAGIVRWTGRAGMGVQFLSVGPRETLALHALVAGHRARAGTSAA
jgi:hypothetical protein